MQAVLDDNTSMYAQDDTPNNETQYRSRFYVNPNSLALGSGEAVDLFTGRNGTDDVLRIQLQKNGATYQIRAGLLPDGTTTWTDTSWYDVPNSWSAVEIHYQAFANSGSLTLWLDDAQKQSLTFIDNDTRTVTDVRLGAQGVDTNTSGALYFDDFESRRFSYIGTLTDPGVDDPQATNQAGWFTRTYQYSATIPHAVSSVTSEQSAVDSYEYDLNGNMICRIENGVTYSQAYNAENRISSIAKRTGDCATGTIVESWSFAYDGDGTRVLTAHFTGTSGTPDSTTSYYMGGQYEVKDGTTKKYYSIAGMMVAVNDPSAGSGQAGLQYLLTDHLGSTVAVTNSSGTLTSQQRYLPFGAPRTIPNSPILATDFTYTGQRKLDDGMGGIMDYRARFYSPALMRFLQPDSIIPNPVNPQAYNRYTYVLNAPIRFNDPTGNMHLCGVQIPEEDCQDESPAPVPPLGGGGDGPPSTLDDFENMTWQERKDWLNNFVEENDLGDWFNDIEGAIDFMASDSYFSRDGSPAEVMDAAVLQAINDGWLIHSGQNAVGGGGQGWALFFDLLKPPDGGQPTASQQELNTARLLAEQIGVDYSYNLYDVQSAISNSSTLEQIYFGEFKFWADAYRSLGIDGGGGIICPICAGNIDPRKSGGFLVDASVLLKPWAITKYSWLMSLSPMGAP